MLVIDVNSCFDVLICLCFFFFFKQKTAYDMRISDWSSDVCSSDLFKAAFSDDVLLDLSGPAANDETELEHIVPLPRPAVPLTRAVVIENAQFAHGVDCQRGYLVSEFTALQLDDQLRHAARLSPKVEIGRAHVCTPVTHAQLVCRLLLEKKKQETKNKPDEHKKITDDRQNI